MNFDGIAFFSLCHLIFLSVRIYFNSLRLIERWGNYTTIVLGIKSNKRAYCAHKPKNADFCDWKRKSLKLFCVFFSNFVAKNRFLTDFTHCQNPASAQTAREEICLYVLKFWHIRIAFVSDFFSLAKARRRKGLGIF